MGRAAHGEAEEAQQVADAEGFRQLGRSLAEEVHTNFEEWPYRLPDGDDFEKFGTLGGAPTHSLLRQFLAKKAREQFQQWWEKATAAADREESKVEAAP